VTTTAGITGATTLLAVLGDPISHAASPALANARLVARGIDACLVPWQVPAAQLPAAVRALRAVRNLRGAIITMPHKIAVMSELDRALPAAAAVGAANVVRRVAGDRLEGTNLDGEGFIEGVLAAGHVLAGRHVLVLGAGGAAAAIAFALCRHGVASLSIYNRTGDAADRLCERLRWAFPGLAVHHASRPDAAASDLIVNATSLGMAPTDPLPMDVDTLRAGSLAAEVVIAPSMTPFLQAAADRGCSTHPGRPMLLAQIDLMLDFMLSGDGIP